MRFKRLSTHAVRQLSGTPLAHQNVSLQS